VAPVLAVCLLLALGMPATAGSSDASWSTNKEQFRKGSDVLITLENTGSEDLTFESPWRVEDEAGNELATMSWEEHEQTLEPGDSLEWSYPQDFNHCGSDGACTTVGGNLLAGRYEAVVETSVGELRADFLVGRYFTLGFRCCPTDEFVVFVAEEKPARRMSRQARKDTKTLAVSGIVRGKASYNPDWSYTMGPRSIVLGEVFIEVCDAAPSYVEENQDEWRGQRWCPWSSYVERRGR
jgi:hypothetical protein